MYSFILIAICIISGILMRKFQITPQNAHKTINVWLIYIALPAVSFKYLPYIEWNNSLIFPIIAPIIVWFGAGIFTKILAKKQSFSVPTQAGFQLASGLSNTSFLGFPLIAAYFGEQYIGIGVICDQITFIILSTFGIAVATKTQRHKSAQNSSTFLLKKIISFPPFIGCVLALTIPKFIHIEAIQPITDTLAQTLSPLALFSIGLQLNFKEISKQIKNVSYLLSYKLFIAPTLVLIIALLFSWEGKNVQISIFEMAMASLISSGIVAEKYHADPEFTNGAIGASIILSLLTTGIWYFLIIHLIA